MFTVRHDRNGESMFYTACQVQRIGPHANAGPEAVHLLCSPDEAGPGIAAKMLRGGTVWIMNEQGATVGHFDLPPEPPCATVGGGH